MVLQNGIGSVDGDLIVGLQEVVRIEDLREDQQRSKGGYDKKPVRNGDHDGGRYTPDPCIPSPGRSI